MATNDIYGFNAQYQSTPILTAKEMKLTVEGLTTDEEYLVQNVSLNYTRQINDILELSSPNIYYNEQAPVGVLNVGRIIGVLPISAVLGKTGQGIFVVGDAAEGQESGTRVAELSPLQGTPGPTYKMYGCVVTTFGMDMDANSGLVREVANIRFGSLQIV